MLTKPIPLPDLRACHDKELKCFEPGAVLGNTVTSMYPVYFLERFSVGQLHKLQLRNAMHIIETLINARLHHHRGCPDISQMPYKHGDIVVLSYDTTGFLTIAHAHNSRFVLASAQDSASYVTYKRAQVAYSEQEEQKVVKLKQHASTIVGYEDTFRSVQEAIEEVLDKSTVANGSERIADAFVRAWGAIATSEKPDYGELDDARRYLVDRFHGALLYIA